MKFRYYLNVITLFDVKESGNGMFVSHHCKSFHKIFAFSNQQEDLNCLFKKDPDEVYMMESNDLKLAYAQTSWLLDKDMFSRLLPLFDSNQNRIKNADVSNLN